MEVLILNKYHKNQYIRHSLALSLFVVQVIQQHRGTLSVDVEHFLYFLVYSLVDLVADYEGCYFLTDLGSVPSMQHALQIGYQKV